MKKILSIILVISLVFSFVSCGDESKDENKGEKLTLYSETGEGENLRLSVDFYYPGDAKINIEENDEHPNWVDIHYESENITISPAIFEDTTFDDNKEYDRENHEDFKEFKINGYDCYGYEAFGGYWIYVHLEELSDTTDRYLAIDTETIDYSKDFKEGIAQYENEAIKKFIESFEYNGVVEYPPAEEDKK